MAIVIILLVCIALPALAWLIALALVCFAAKRRRDPTPADCIIVLGAKTLPDGGLTATLQGRVDAAAEGWRRGLAPWLILCGGAPEAGSVSEAAAMRGALARAGVPEDAMLLDEDSRDTLENMDRAAKIMRARGWKSAVVVTSDYHVARALRIARDAGIAAQGLASPSPESRAGYWKARFREVLGWGLYVRTRLFPKWRH